MNESKYLFITQPRLSRRGFFVPISDRQCGAETERATCPLPEGQIGRKKSDPFFMEK